MDAMVIAAFRPNPGRADDLLAFVRGHPAAKQMFPPFALVAP